VALVVVLLVVGYVVYRLATAGHESTDDANVRADIVAIAARVTAPVARVLKMENAAVHKDDLLFLLDDADLSAKVRQSEANLESAEAAAEAADAQVRVAEASARGGFTSAGAVVSSSSSEVAASEANVRSARAALIRAEADLRKATTDLHRAHALVAARAVPQQQLDDAQAAFDAATAAVKQYQAQVRAAEDAREAAMDRVREAEGHFRATRPVEAAIATAHANARLARAHVNAAAAQLDTDMQILSYARILAATDGRMSALSVHPGQLVQPGQILAQLVPFTTYVSANFKETQLDGMQVGQPATVEVDALGGRSFDAILESFSGGTGAVFSILPPENATGNFVKVVQRVPVRFAWNEAPDVPLQAGLSVTVKINKRSQPQQPPGSPASPSLSSDDRPVPPASP
jgi:membrane fusion protein (multidrug efflux system)